MSSELKEFIELGVQYLNKKSDLKSLRQKYSPNENRTLSIIITYPNGRVGLHFDENFNLSTGTVLNPTVEARMSENVFWAIVTGKLPFVEAFFDGSLDLIGDNSLRDFVVFSRIFTEFQHLLKEAIA